MLAQVHRDLVVYPLFARWSTLFKTIPIHDQPNMSSYCASSVYLKTNYVITVGLSTCCFSKTDILGLTVPLPYLFHLGWGFWGTSWCLIYQTLALLKDVADFFYDQAPLTPVDPVGGLWWLRGAERCLLNRWILMVFLVGSAVITMSLSRWWFTLWFTIKKSRWFMDPLLSAWRYRGGSGALCRSRPRAGKPRAVCVRLPGSVSAVCPADTWDLD